jgi:superfamily II helicase
MPKGQKKHLEQDLKDKMMDRITTAAAPSVVVELPAPTVAQRR